MNFPRLARIINNAHLFFIPPNYRTDEVVFRKCKVFINTTLVTSIFAFFFLGNAIMFHMPMATIAMIICCILFFSFAWLLKYGVPFRVCTNCYIALGIIATTWDAYWAGGLNSIHTPWFVFPSIGAILVGTVKEGRIWLGISIAILLSFGIAALKGYQFPNELGNAYHDAMAISAYAGLIIILFVVVLVVENAYLESLKKLETAMESLRKSQAQLIHQERLALLGQMIAGIAHEIQNPLNFVNNFSSVSKELLEDLREAKTEEERNQAMHLLTENLSRIEQHGKRVEIIVKDMLMHSKVHPGEKQLTDIHRLCEEAVSLVYQNLKANTPDAEIKIEQNYGASNYKANVIPQEISRVVLNLLENAFYSVNQKKKMKDSKNENYIPSITLTTQSTANGISILISDNGNGIPQQIIDNVFQPFFTTKPAREGTGLGLSISYDIIKAHGGEIKAESLEMENASFTILLPA